MSDIGKISALLNEQVPHLIQSARIALGELTVDVAPNHLRELCLFLRDDPALDFVLLLDVCGVDYLHYGIAEWETQSATATGFSRGVETRTTPVSRSSDQPRFATVYHLLSLSHNHRIRLRALLDNTQPQVDSVCDIWASANWYEREAFDLFGILFKGHPDLRRLLTDYGFIGHPFRKDFPLIGEVEMRYDATLGRVIYEPVSIEPRVLEPKVIRDDARYNPYQTGA